MTATAPLTNNAYRGIDGTVKVVPSDVPRELKSKEILIKITHSSICGTDVHMIGAGCALGHEGVGIVEKIGSEVTQLKVGDRAAVGYLRNSCGHCSYCLGGQEVWCYERNVYGEKDFNSGTFSDYYIGTETFVFKVPDNLPSELAAPLQCAGATVYSALTGVLFPSARVGIIGIGGLGHLAIQFSAKLGHDTVVFSTKADKEAEAKAFGATEFHLLSEVDKVSKPIDILIVAGSKYPDWNAFLNKNVLARGGTIVPLSAPSEDFKLPSFPMFFDGYNIHSSLVATRKVHGDMLEFAGKHGIKPVIETFEFSEKGFGEALTRLNDGKLRYRGVLVR